MSRLISTAVLGLLLSGVLGQAPVETYSSRPPVRHAGMTPIPENLFGMHIINGNYPTTPFGVLRTSGVGWPQLERSKGRFDWSKLDAQVSLAMAHNLKVYYTTENVPAWAARDLGGCKANGCGSGVLNLADWDEFVAALVDRYRGRIEVYELWNEPDQNFTGPLSDLVPLAQHFHDLVRAHDPAALVAGPGVVTVAWLGAFWEAGAPRDLDAVAFHGYSTPPLPEILEAKKIAPLRAIMDRYGLSDKPVWDSEASWGELKNAPDPQVQAGLVARYYLLQWSSGVSRFYWYSWDDNGSGPSPGWGSLANWQSNTPFPAAIAYQEVYKWMVGAAMSTPCHAASDSTWTCVLRRDKGYQALAVWNSSNTRSYTAATEYTQYRDLAGNVRPVTGPVIIGSQPILLETAGAAGRTTPARVLSRNGQDARRP